MSQALWFASRGTGLVSLLLLSATVVLGTVHTSRTAGARWPRFTLHAVHRNLSLLAVAFLAVHVGAVIADPYVQIGVLDAIVPFGSSYKPFYLGLGAVALDLMIAIIGTSLVRTRIPLRVWQWVHYAAYALFPLAVVHGWGTGGQDSGLLWVRAVYVFCVAAVVVAVARRWAVRGRLVAPHTVRVPRQRAESGADARVGVS